VVVLDFGTGTGVGAMGAVVVREVFGAWLGVVLWAVAPSRSVARATLDGVVARTDGDVVANGADGVVVAIAWALEVELVDDGAAFGVPEARSSVDDERATRRPTKESSIARSATAAKIATTFRPLPGSRR
jgi:hypothetical protein